MLAGKSVDVEVCLPSDREIQFTCCFQRSARLLFDAWTKPEHLNRWWGCEGSTITHCAIDLRPGGSWSLTMRMADGSDHPFHGTYREVMRPHRLVYSECYDMPQFGSPEWLTTVTFEETPAATVITHTILHKSREVRDGHLQAGMQEGMVQTLARLNEHIAAVEPLE
jgi:uncharacterized protein YndB with AHSA1/START domain